MKRASDVASIRSLCSLDLPAEQLIPAVLEALHDIIPSARNLFDWADARGNLVRYFVEGPIDAEVTRHYFDEFYNRREQEVMPAFRRVLEGSVVRGAAELDHPAFFRSALYNEVWKPQGLHYRIEAVIHGTRNQPLGSLVLYRAPGEPIFTRDEEALLGALVPYIARALEKEGEAAQDYVARGGRRAMLSLSSEGEVLHVSQDAHRMLLLASGGITPDAAGRAPSRSTFPTLALLADQVRQNPSRAQRSPTRMTVQNAWGRFQLEAEPLIPLDPGAPYTIHVTVCHDEPRVVAQRRRLGMLPLSVAQREVCLLVHAGYTQSDIAAALCVAPSTVADHVKKIYAKLDVHSARELRQMLDSVDSEGASR